MPSPPSPPSPSTVRAAVRAAQPTQSGVGFVMRGDHLILTTPDATLPVDADDAALLRYGQAVMGLPYADTASLEDEATYQRATTRAAHDALARAHLGGAGVSDRGLDQLDATLPGAAAALTAARGRVVFLGNGLSDAPLWLATHNPHAHPVAIDCFAYDALARDLDALTAALADLPWPAPLPRLRAKCAALCAAAAAGQLTLLRYVVGAGQPPEAARGASLVINCHGPSDASLPDQLALLAVGGVLLCTCAADDLPSGFLRTPITRAGHGVVGAHVTRLA